MNKKTKLINKIKNCKTCNNERHVTVDGKRVRCSCYSVGLFIALWEDAEGDEVQVDSDLVSKLKNHFRKHDIALVYNEFPVKRNAYLNSALYLATNTLHSARAVTDLELRDMIFNGADEEKSAFVIERITCYDLLVIQIAMIHNKAYVSQYLMEAIARRKRLGLKTLLLANSHATIVEKYRDEELNKYLKALEEAGAQLK